MRLLLAEDEKELSKALCAILKHNNYSVDPVFNGQDALDYGMDENYDGIILDLMMPKKNGLEVLRELREAGISTPVLILTAKAQLEDKILGLDTGADDYLTKPFDAKELVARVKAVLRRTQGGEEEKKTDLSFPGLTVSIAEYAVYYEGKRLDMPPKELEVLYFLASSPNQVFTREQLLKQVWGFDFFGDSRTVDVHIKRLREKLPDSEKYGWSIFTVRGVGYKFELN